MGNTLAQLDLRQIANALGGDVRNDEVLAPGPGHSRDDRSLSIKLDPNAPGGFLVHSYARDDPIECKDFVRQKCNLPTFNGQRRHRSSEEIDELMRRAVRSQAEKPKGRLTATYDYKDENGALLYQVLRYDQPKSFRQRRPDGNGGWIWKLEDRRVLYRWPELLQYPDATAILCEGEKDVGNVAALDLCATTVASGKWTDQCVEALRGRDVIILQDNDAAGAKKAQEAAQLLHSVASTVRVVLLPNLPEGGDISDWLDADPRLNTKDRLIEICFDTPLWGPTSGVNEPATSPEARPHDVQQSIGEYAPPVEKPAEKPTPLPFIDVGKWHEQPPAREWSTPERFPLRQVCLLSGEGAVGKSIVLLQLCAAHALGRDWLQALPEPGPAIYLGAEDDATEIWRRMVPIVQHHGANMAELAPTFHALDFAGKNAVLAAPDRKGVVQATSLFQQLKEAACDIKPKLIGLDTAADIFAGEENDRSQVRQFIGLLRGMAIAADATVLVCTHPSLTGINTGTGLSGSTAWHNSVRARAYLHPATTSGGEESDPELRELTFKKNNYGPIAERVLLRWKAGVFVPEPRTGSLEKLAADQRAEETFLTLLGRFEEQGRTVSASPTANNYAPTVFAKEPGANSIRKEALAEGMRRLFHSRRIRVEQYGRPSRPASKLVKTTQTKEKQ